MCFPLPLLPSLPVLASPDTPCCCVPSLHNEGGCWLDEAAGAVAEGVGCTDNEAVAVAAKGDTLAEVPALLGVLVRELE